MKNIQFIYFDVGEVLIKGATSKELAEDLLGVDHKAFKKVYDTIDMSAYKAQIKPKEILAIYKREFPNMKKINMDTFWQEWVNSLSQMKETHQLIYDLSKKYNLGILTNSYEGLFEMMQDSNLLPKVHFASIIESSAVGLAKPEKEIYTLAEKMAGVTGENILFVDNREPNIKGAIACGWQAFLFDETNPQESVNTLRKMLL